MSRRRSVELVVFGVAAALVAACGGGSENTAKVVIEAQDFAFVPAEVTVPVGEVTVELRNTDSITHDLRLDVGGPHIEAGARSARSAVMRFDEPGEYRFICTIPGHAEGGMVGVFTVVEQ